MATDARNLVAVLKAELEFLNNGGYRRAARTSWRPAFIFQDSPTCLNADPVKPPRPCNQCVLMQLIPEGAKKRSIPCRHIALNEQGETVSSFYRSGTPEELEDALRRWLKMTIARLEKEKVAQSTGTDAPEIHVRAKSSAGL